MSKFKHSFWRYIPSTDERQSFFKFVESFETDNDSVPKFDDHNCIDHIVNLENGQMRVSIAHHIKQCKILQETILSFIGVCIAI